MSGGSYNYIYSRLKDECGNNMYDEEMNDLINDLCEVLHDLEWWQSCDTSEESYRKTLTKFKKKWFKGNREERLKMRNKQYYGLEQFDSNRDVSAEELLEAMQETFIRKAFYYFTRKFKVNEWFKTWVIVDGVHYDIEIKRRDKEGD